MDPRSKLAAPLSLLVAFCAVLVLAWRGPQATSGPLSLAAQRPEDAPLVGRIVDWRLVNDGTVYLLVDGRRGPTGADSDRASEGDREAARLWFKTPPIQGQQIHFQDLVLFVVLNAQQRGTPPLISIWGDPTPVEQGQSIDEAISIAMIGQS